MINCIALDDEPMALEVINAFCEKIPYINLTHRFTQVSKAKNHLKNFPVDLVFLDIQMPDVNGIDFYKSLEHPVMGIFITAYSDFAIEGFNVDAIDYLLKPIEFERFKTACEKARDYHIYLLTAKTSEKDCLFVRSEYSLVKIPLNDILFLETMDDYIRIYRQDDSLVLTLTSMTKILKKLPGNQFVRVHRSYTVSMDKIESVRGRKIKIGDRQIPIGASYRKEFNEHFNK